MRSQLSQLLLRKYVIDGKPGITPLQFFAGKVTQLKTFLRNYRNKKIRIVMVCLVEQKNIEEKNGKTRIIYNQDKSYFHSETHEIYESTDEKVILCTMIDQMMEKFS